MGDIRSNLFSLLLRHRPVRRLAKEPFLCALSCSLSFSLYGHASRSLTCTMSMFSYFSAALSTVTANGKLKTAHVDTNVVTIFHCLMYCVIQLMKKIFNTTIKPRFWRKITTKKFYQIGIYKIGLNEKCITLINENEILFDMVTCF